MPGRRERLTLKRRDIQRIATVVRDAERGDRDLGATRLPTSSGGEDLVRGTFNGDWAKGETKEVTDAQLSAITYQAKNYVANILPSGTMGCQICYTAGEWILVAWDWTALSGHDGTKQQVLAHNASGQLVWLNTTACT